MVFIVLANHFFKTHIPTRVKSDAELTLEECAALNERTTAMLAEVEKERTTVCLEREMAEKERVETRHLLDDIRALTSPGPDADEQHVEAAPEFAEAPENGDAGPK